MDRGRFYIEFFFFVFSFFFFVFFFEAEDVIRDLVRSRGLGEVYKSQGATGCGHLQPPERAGLPPPRRF